jgi:hypothetical protein
MELGYVEETKKDIIERASGAGLARVGEWTYFERHSTSFRAFQEVSPFDGVGKRHGYDV